MIRKVVYIDSRRPETNLIRVVGDENLELERHVIELEENEDLMTKLKEKLEANNAN